MTHQARRYQALLPHSQREINAHDYDNAILSDLYVLIHLILKTTLQGKYYYYSCFTDEESEAQRN